MRFATIVARFNAEITERLLDGARECFADHGVTDDRLEITWVPGAFELPLAAMMSARSSSIDAVVALGCVVRGDTPHFDYVCQAAAYGLQRVGLDTGIPIAFGVLTTDDFDQAKARAGGALGNKGYDAAQTAIEMAVLARG